MKIVDGERKIYCHLPFSSYFECTLLRTEITSTSDFRLVVNVRCFNYDSKGKFSTPFIILIIMQKVARALSFTWSLTFPFLQI